MEGIVLKGEYITLGQAMKAAGLVMTGGEAKEHIAAGRVLVNGQRETRRGRKLYKGDCITFKEESCMVT